MQQLRRAHEGHVEEERAAEREKEKQRKARAKAEREQRMRVAAKRAQPGSSSAPSSTPAPWPQGLPITGADDAAARARREAGKSASLEQVAEHLARLRQQEAERVQEELRRMETLRLAKLIQRGY
jgi:predicted house-cleaning NTP pyrophosphatase (Maf/HAM1 superfamily)